MRISYTFTAAHLVIGCLTSPTSHQNADVSASFGVLELCSGVDYTDNCRRFREEYGHCTNLGGIGSSTIPWWKKVKSARPDPGTWCTLYEHSNCQGNEMNVFVPGISDLGDFNDKAGSFNCAAQ